MYLILTRDTVHLFLLLRIRLIKESILSLSFTNRLLPAVMIRFMKTTSDDAPATGEALRGRIAVAGRHPGGEKASMERGAASRARPGAQDCP